MTSLTAQVIKMYAIEIVQIYSPIITHQNEEIDEFHNVTKILYNNKSHFDGERNTTIGKRKTQKQVEKYGFVIKKRKRRKTDFASHHNRSSSKTLFKKKINRKWLSEAPNGSNKNEINYILSN